MATDAPLRPSDATMDAKSLYREEIYTDRKVGTLRVLVPVQSDGSPDPARPTIFQGEAQLMTNMGPLPISFDIEAKDLAAAVANYAEATKAGVERAMRELQDLRRQASSSIVIPQGGAAGLAARRRFGRRRQDSASVAPGLRRGGDAPRRVDREVRDEKVDERSHLRGQVPPAWISRVDVDRFGRIVGQDPHQPSGAQLGRDDEIGLETDAEPGHRQRAEHLAVVRMRGPCDPHRVLDAVGVREAPRIAIGRVLVAQTGVARQVRRYRWGPVCRQISRRRAAE